MGLGLTGIFGTYLLGADGSVVYFDCVTNEQVTRDADITEFPVEQGANISDHYRVKLSDVKLDVFVSNEPINPLIHPEGGGFFGAQTLVTPEYPQQLASTLAKAVLNPAGSAVNVVGGLLDSTTRPVVMNSVLQYPSPFDSLANLLTTLDAMRAGAVKLTIVTASQIYDGFLIGKAETTRDKETGSGAKVSLEFKRIITVSTQSVAAPKPALAKDKPPVNKGAQQLVPPGQMQSLASALLGLFRPAAPAFTGVP